MKNFTLKTLLLLAIMLIGGGNYAWAQSTLYFWQGGENNYAQMGGTIAASDGSGNDASATEINIANSTYKVIRLQGVSDFDGNYTVTITLDAALATGDIIRVTGYRNKNAANKKSGFKAKFNNGGTVASSTGLEYVNIDTSDASSGDSNRGTEPNTCTFEVPAAANGSTTVTMTRSHQETFFWITKIEIVRPNTVYSKTLSQWTSSDLTEWVGNKADYGKATKTDESTVDIMTRTANSSNGLYFNSLGGRTSDGYTSDFTATACDFTKSITTHDNTILQWDAVWNPGEATGTANNTQAHIQFGDVVFYFYGSSWYSKVKIGSADAIQIEGAGKTRSRDYTISAIINKITKEVNYTFTDNGTTKSGSGTTGGTFESVKYGIGGKMPNWSLSSNIKSISITEVPVPMANYTIRYVDGEGTEIKTSDASRYSYVGADVPDLLATDKETFKVDTKKYIYESDDLDGKSIESDGSTVVTVTFREAETWNYTIKSSTGTTISSSTGVEGEVISYHYKQVMNENGVLYTAPAINNQYKSSFTLTSNNQEVTVTYTPSATVTNLVFLAECEDIFTRGTGSNADIRCSMGAGGYASSETAFVTLPAGTYQLFITNRCSKDNSGTHIFKAGDKTILSSTDHGYNHPQNSDEFTLTCTTTLTMSGGNNTNIVDWIYITGTPDDVVKTSSANLLGYKTFYDADFNYQVDESTTIYKASAYTAGKSVTLTPVAGKIVPKNTPVVLKTTDAGYNITLTPTASDSEDDFTVNLLGVYKDSEWSKSGSLVVYMLGYTESEKFGLYLYTATPDEGDIAVLVPSGGTAKKVSLVVDGEATEVVAPEVAETEEEEVLYNMAGIQVDKNFKGVVINQKGVKRFNR